MAHPGWFYTVWCTFPRCNYFLNLYIVNIPNFRYRNETYIQIGHSHSVNHNLSKDISPCIKYILVMPYSYNKYISMMNTGHSAILLTEIIVLPYFWKSGLRWVFQMRHSEFKNLSCSFPVLLPCSYLSLWDKNLDSSTFFNKNMKINCSP